MQIPVFIWAPEEEGQFQPGRCSRWWSKHSLIDLQQALAALGSRLIIRRSTDSTAALLKVVSEVGAEAVFFNHLYDPISLMRDHDCKRGLKAASVAHRTFNGDMLYEPWDVLDGNKQPYSTFDDYWNSVRTMPVPPPFPISAPAAMPPVAATVASMTVAEVDWFFTAEQEASSDQLNIKSLVMAAALSVQWKPGVGGAIAELERFLVERLYAFEHDRAKVDRDSTSRLSPWIHIGSISVRYIFYRVRQCQAEWMVAGVDRTRSCDDFLQQVGYREYSRYLSFHFPFIHERSLLRHLRACPWRIDQLAFKAWRQGQTGYPIVDAAMRQLWSSGWCHNRARVVAASFLVKDLLLPWQWGLKHYWDAQIDADLECDALGWQYVSGGMSDAHPFSYMMDLEKEARRFDPDGEYVRRWLPVLSRLPTEFIHAPWKASPQVLAAADVELGCNYPMPIITRGDACANVQYACSVLDKCVVAQSSESSGRYPYRAPTYPMAGGGGASSGANPTGTGGVNNGAGASAGTAGGSGRCANTNGAPHESSGRDSQQVQQQQYHLLATSQPGADGAAEGCGAGGSGHGYNPLLPDSRTVSAAHGGISSGGAGSGRAANCPTAAATAAGIMAPPPPQQPQYPRSGSGGGMGGSLGAGGSGQAAAPPGGAVYYHPGDAAGHQMLERILQQQRRARGAPRQQDGSGTDRPPQPGEPAAAGDAAAAWAQRVEAGEEDGDAEAVALWQQQQQQALQGGTAAMAFEQAMQILLARRRMGDGVSAISGEAGGAGEEGLMGEDADSEEVVSNTVDLNMTALTGASCHRHLAGTARGARQRERAACAGSKRAVEECEDERSPGGSSPRKSEGDEADPAGFAAENRGHPERRRADRSKSPGGAAEMQCDGDADAEDEARDADGDGATPEGLTPDGGERGDSPSASSGYEEAQGSDDPMEDSDTDVVSGGGAKRHGDGVDAGRAPRPSADAGGQGQANPQHGHAAHKRRRSRSSSIEWE
ncbi:hypothetical protein GPECTOR_51g745 [Gonium pectorale]|uniref:Photolyase/cryptochrome alpha/beta domain-containing protein n=1 Tax=Gonium pectorale TaxID=33097 RepID=A0A150G7B8_GONPE|nr:hypothetical protein GPECTOR_51g745 [Gonium pectorale]|eukprot:KXZ45759.1 hypothetical protein GPECTOR_51g745 [Gonium pectorale]